MKLFKWRWLKYDFIGFAIAVLFAGISFTPSLLPRPPLLQGVIAGLAAVSGYIFGCLLSWLLRHLISWRPSARTVKYSWFVLLGATVVTAAVMLPLGNHWQNQLHDSMGLEAPPVVASPGIFIITAIIFIGLIALGRGIRALARLIAKPVRRVVPQRIVRPVSAVLAIFLLYTAIDGVLFRYINEGVNSTFSGKAWDAPALDSLIHPVPVVVLTTMASRWNPPACFMSSTALSARARVVGRRPSRYPILLPAQLDLLPR